MAQSIEKDVYARLSDLIQRKIGLHFPEGRWNDLERGVRAAALELGFEDTASCIQGLLGAPVTKVQLDTLVAHLTVGETFFLRDESHFNVLRDQIIPQLQHSRRNGRAPRFWSAACCTGEEPYTIAMIMDRLQPFWREGDFSILATDINSRFLQKARKGVYTNWSLRNAPKWMVERYFTVQGKNRFEIDPKLKRGLRFSNLNMVDPVYPSPVTQTEDLDVVFCRNVLMYFSQDLRNRVIERLCWALADGGWLFVGPSEVAFVEHPNLQYVRFPGAIMFQKQAAKNQVQAPRAPETPRPESKARALGPSAPPAPETEREPAPARQETASPGPEHRDRLHEEALGMIEKGRYEEAVERLLPLVSVEDSGDGLAPDVRGMALLARTYANMGRHKEARGWGVRCVEMDKLNPGHRYLLGAIHEEMGEYKKAAEMLQSALFLDSRFILAHFTLGNTVLRQGKAPEAKRHFKNALSLLLDLDSETVIPHSGGMTAGRLTEIVRSMIIGD